MHWDFFTVLSVASGVVLIIAALGGPVVGTARERLGIFGLGAFSLAYGIWVATQVSGFFLFSVAPAALAIVIVIRAVQHAARNQVPAARPGPGAGARSTGASSGGVTTPLASSPSTGPGQPNRSAASALRAAQPERVRQAVHARSTAFCPAFQLPGAAELSLSATGTEYLSRSLGLGWSLAAGQPVLPTGEQLFGIWQASARLKVAVDSDLSPTPPKHNISWVTVMDGTGLIALSSTQLTGIVVSGDGLLGAFDRVGGTGVALWRLPLLRLASVSVTPVGRGDGLLLSSADPAGHVTLSGMSTAEVLSTAEVPGGQPVPVPPQHLADMINRIRTAHAGIPQGGW